MKNRIFNNWSLARVFRVAIGIVVVCDAIYSKDMLIGLAGSIYLGLSLFNISSCDSGACYTPIKNTKGNLKDVSYEETA